jgi:hypothetical protein
MEYKFDKGKYWKELKFLELVCSEVVGRFPSLSFNKALYLLTFIDDFSRYTYLDYVENEMRYKGKYSKNIEIQ